MISVQIKARFPKGYIGHPYWPEMAKMVDIQKSSGMNRAKSTANRRKALEEHLRSIGMNLEQYEALERKSKEPFYRNGTGLIIIPELHVTSFLVATCDEARAATRPCESNQVRSRFVCSPWTTGKQDPDGNFERFVTVTSGTGQKLSNQRGFRSNPFIADFDAQGTIVFDEEFVDPATLKRAIEFGGMFVGIGACRPMGWGRFDLKEFSHSSPPPTPTPPTSPSSSNRPPILTADGLNRDYKHLDDAINELRSRAEELPPVVEDEDDLSLITGMVKELRTKRQHIVAVGESETRPLLEAQRVAHAFFKALAARLTDMQTDMESRGNAFLERKKEVERKRREEIERKAREDAEKARLAVLDAAKVAAEKAAAAAKPEVPLLAKQDEEQAKASAATALDTFAQANVAADQAKQAATAKPSELARTRTTAGTATLGETVTFTFDQETLDLEILRPFLRTDELSLAIRAVMRKRKDEVAAGTLVIKGVVFKRETRGRYT